MKKVTGRKLLSLFFSLILLLVVSGCNKKPKLHPNNNEINVLRFFISKTEHNGPTQILEFKKAKFDDNTLIYYVKWHFETSDNDDKKEHLIFLTINTLKSKIFPLNLIDEYPIEEKKWETVSFNNEFTHFTKEEIDEFLVLAGSLE